MADQSDGGLGGNFDASARYADRVDSFRFARNPFPIRFLGESSGIESNAMPLAPGEQLGHYKIQSPIGRGGMGEACITIRAQIC